MAYTHLAEKVTTDLMFDPYNHNKQRRTLNPSKLEERAIQDKFIGSADNVAADTSANTSKKFGLDYESLKIIKEDIIPYTAATCGAMGP